MRRHQKGFSAPKTGSFHSKKLNEHRRQLGVTEFSRAGVFYKLSIVWCLLATAVKVSWIAAYQEQCSRFVLVSLKLDFVCVMDVHCDLQGVCKLKQQLSVRLKQTIETLGHRIPACSAHNCNNNGMLRGTYTWAQS